MLSVVLLPGIARPPFVALLVLWALNGSGQALIAIASSTLLASHTSEGERGRVYAPCCSGRMKLLALVTDPTSVARYLRGIGEPTDVPKRTPARGPPYWASRVLRRGAGSVEAAE